VQVHPLLECKFLIPIRRDRQLSDGKLHSLEKWKWLQQQLGKQFRGWTKAPGLYQGNWINPKTGQLISDKSVMFLVAVWSEKMPRLRQLLKQACKQFRQECIYLSMAGRVEFVEEQS
jgi:hypothetical protein